MNAPLGWFRHKIHKDKHYMHRKNFAHGGWFPNSLSSSTDPPMANTYGNHVTFSLYINPWRSSWIVPIICSSGEEWSFRQSQEEKLSYDDCFFLSLYVSIYLIIGTKELRCYLIQMLVIDWLEQNPKKNLMFLFQLELYEKNVFPQFEQLWNSELPLQQIDHNSPIFCSKTPKQSGKISMTNRLVPSSQVDII